MYAKFYDLTFLYPDYQSDNYINDDDEEQYHNVIRNHLRNNNIYRDGDIIFIGSTYESRQEYGFATVINNGTDFKQYEYPLMDVPGVYYKKTMDEIDAFWEQFTGSSYFDLYDKGAWVTELKQKGRYELPKENWKSLLPKAKEASVRRKINEDVLSEYFPLNVSDKISRYSVFGKHRKVQSDILYLKS